MPIVFSDSGLHLAVLNALLRREILQESELRKLLAGIESDEEEDRYRERELIRTAINRLHDLAVPDDEVARIEGLDFGSRGTYPTSVFKEPHSPAPKDPTYARPPWSSTSLGRGRSS